MQTLLETQSKTENMLRALSDTNLHVGFRRACGMAENSIPICVRESTSSPKIISERKPGGEEVTTTDNKTAKHSNKIEVTAIYELCNVAKYGGGAATPKMQRNFQKPKTPRYVAARWKFTEDPDRIEVLSSHEICKEEMRETHVEEEATGCFNGGWGKHGLGDKLKTFCQRVKFQIRRGFVCMCKTADS